MCPYGDWFTEMSDLQNTYILTADNTPVEVLGKGTIQVLMGKKVIQLADVLFVPSLSMPLFSVRVHRKRSRGCYFLADYDICALGFPSFSLKNK